MTDQYPFPLTGYFAPNGRAVVSIPAAALPSLLSLFSGIYTVAVAVDAKDGNEPTVVTEMEDLGWSEVVREIGTSHVMYPHAIVNVADQATGRVVARFTPRTRRMST